ncbi:MAG: glycosyltransferase family 4 protein [Acidimicrobiia bacterium]|nr:glycosyltransferase family 4 protein [Acidimicrobiia bacterium]
MKLLVVTNDYPPKPGGIQQYLGSFLAAFPGEYRVVAPADEPAVDEDRVRRHRRRFMWPTASVARFIDEAIADFSPDVVLFGAPYPLTRLAKRIGARGIPTAVLCHGAEITIPAALPPTRYLLRRWLRSADVRFAVSQFTRRRVQRLTGRDVVYLGAGVDLETFTPGETTWSEPPVVGCVSRFVPRKGHARVIEAASQLARLGRPVSVLIVGRGRLEKRLRRLADRSGVDVRFEVDVPWSRIAELYREIDIFAMPCRSRWFGLEVEGLGLVFLEAAAAGLPVLVGDSGGSPETVLPGETGYVAADVASLVEGIGLFLDDPERATSMGRAGREWVSREFTWDRVVERFASGLGRDSR